MDPLAWSLAGNYVIIRHEGGEYSLLAHLRRGSVRVRPGDRVRQGQVMGECGNSGSSSEPHLHFQVQDHPNFLLCASLPVRFSGWCWVGRQEVGGLGGERLVAFPPEYQEEGFLVRGDLVEACAAQEEPRPLQEA